MPNPLRYAMGANSANAGVVKPVSSLDAGNLSITAIVRINDPKVSIVGQSASKLTDWSTTPIEGVRTTDQEGATVGETERQVFSVPRGGTKTFLQQRATMTN
jgi:hypothetical protein